MPPVGAAVVAAATYLGATAATATLLGAIAQVGVVAAGLAFAMKGKQPGGVRNEGEQRTMLRQSTATRTRVYGRARVSGPLAYLQHTHNHKVVHGIVMLAGHRVSAIREIWFGDHLAWSSVDGYQEVPYSNHSPKRRYNHRNDDGDEFSQVASLSVRLGIPGQAHYDSLERALILHELNGGLAVGPFSYNAATGDFEESTVQYYKELDSGGDRLVRKQRTVTRQLDPSELPAVEWTSDHRLEGIASIYWRLRWAPWAYPNGVPNVSALVDGVAVWDPRAESDPSVKTYTNNAALCLLDYLMSEDGLRCGIDEIDVDSFIAAANVSDEAVPLAAGGTEARYTIDGVIHLDRKRGDIIQEMLGAMSGALTNVGGRWHLNAGTYTAPTITLTSADFVGDVQISTAISRASKFNALTGTFIDPELDYVEDQYPEVASPVFAAEDGEEIVEGFDLLLSGSSARCQRLARVALNKSRRETVVSGMVGGVGLQLAAGQTVAIDFPEIGLNGKVFEIDDWKPELSSAGLGVRLVLIETAPEVYSWTAADEVIRDAISAGGTPEIGLEAPAFLGYDAISEPMADGSYTSRVELYCNRSETDEDVSYEFQIRPVGGAWVGISSTEPSVTFSDLAFGRRIRRASAILTRAA